MIQAVLQQQPILSVKAQLELPDAVHAIAESFKGTELAVVWKDIPDDKSRIKHWLGADVADAFLDLGGLKKQCRYLPSKVPVIPGQTMRS